MSDTFPHTPADDLKLLKAAAVHAGIIALGFFRSEYKSWIKNVSSPVSEADIAVNDFLAQCLPSARPDYGWLSEESADDDRRLGCRRVFVIDPIDGTRGFIAGEDSWTISMAIVEDGIPMAGVVYAPARDELYEAARGGGAWFNGVAMGPGEMDAETLPLIPAPIAVHKELVSGGLSYERGPAYPSLAYRLVQVAAGTLDAAVARRGAHDWDIAGADIILSEAGMRLEDVCRGTPLYNRTETRHAALAATGSGSLRSPLHAALRTVYGCPDPEGPTEPGA